MKEFDIVKLINDRDIYLKEGAKKGMIGTIMNPNCIDGTRYVIFMGKMVESYGIKHAEDVDCVVKEEDLEIVYEAPKRKINYEEYQLAEYISDCTRYENHGVKKGMLAHINGFFNNCCNALFLDDDENVIAEIWTEQSDFKLL